MVRVQAVMAVQVKQLQLQVRVLPMAAAAGAVHMTLLALERVAQVAVVMAGLDFIQA